MSKHELLNLRLANCRKEVQPAASSQGIQNLSLQELQLMSSQLIQLQQAQLQIISGELEKVKDAQEKANTKFEIGLEEERQEREKIKELAMSSLRSNGAKEGWVNLTDFGAQYQASMSCIRMAKLLKIVGIAHKKGKTMPLRKWVGEKKLAINQTYNGHSRFLWNYERCSDFIDKWLEANGYFSVFYSIQGNGNEKELANLIDQLYKRYCS
jgi:hypothetical protein